MNLRDTGIVFRKEAIDILRDRRSIIATIVFPIAFFPVLLFGQQRLEEMREKGLEDETVWVAIDGSDRSFRKRIEEDHLIEIRETSNFEQSIRREELQASVILPATFPTKGNSSTEISILYDGSKELSRLARERIRDHVDSWRGELRRERLQEIGAPADLDLVVDVEETNIASEERMAGSKFGRIFPIFLVLILMNGASVIAVDLFSGEKERRTIETLLTSLADRRSVVAGKFLAVVLMAITSVILFLVSNFVAIKLGLTGGAAARASLELSPGTGLVVVLVTLPLAIFLSAVLVLTASHARTYREAQTLLMPIMLLSIVPAAIALLPGIRLDSVAAFAPIANVSLAVREALLGNFPVLPLIAVFLSNAICAVIVLRKAVSYLESEAVVLGPAPSISPARGADRSLVREVNVFYFIQLLLLYYVGSTIQAYDLLSGLLLTLWGLLLIPSLLFARYYQLPYLDTFRLRLPAVGHVVAAALLALPTLFAANLMFHLQSRFLPVPEQLFKEMEGLLDIGGGGLPMLLFAIAVSPGICEELFFRGLILGRHERGMEPWKAILVGGLFFGLFHLSIYRLLPTAIMGIVAGVLAYRSRSIVPPMVLHILYNATVLLGGRFEGLALIDEVSTQTVVGALLLGAAGITLLRTVSAPRAKEYRETASRP